MIDLAGLSPSPSAAPDAAAAPRTALPTGPVDEATPAFFAQGDLFALGRAAAAAARARHGGKGVFSRSRQLLPTGVWKGPRDAADAFVEEADLPAGGLEAARAAGARTLVVTRDAALARAARALGMRVLWRLEYRADEPGAERQARLEALAGHVAGGLDLDGVIPTPVGEPFGLDSITFFARCRLRLDVPHLLADFGALGHRLAQMCLGFGADELFGPIMPERALRLGANAHNLVMTRKEAAMLLRGAGWAPHERVSGGQLEEFTS
jgi:hypothetical protein